MELTETELTFLSEGIYLLIDSVKRSNQLRADVKLDITPLLNLKERLETTLDNMAAQNFNEALNEKVSQMENINEYITKNNIPI